MKFKHIWSSTLPQDMYHEERKERTIWIKMITTNRLRAPEVLSREIEEKSLGKGMYSSIPREEVIMNY